MFEYLVVEGKNALVLATLFNEKVGQKIYHG